MHFQVDIADQSLARQLNEALTDSVVETAVSMPLIFVDETRLQKRRPEFGESVILVIREPASRKHVPLLREGQVHEIVDISTLTPAQMISSCMRADAIAKMVNDALTTRTLEREHFRSTPLALIRTQMNRSKLSAANPAMVTLLGYRNEAEVLAMNPATDLYVDPADRVKRYEEFKKTNAMSPMEFQIKAKGGKVIEVVHQAALVTDHLDQPVYIEGSFIDLSELRKVRRQVEKLNLDLLDAHRQAGMAEIASGVLHNVGNALNSVKVSISTLEDRLASARSGATLRQLAKKIQSVSLSESPDTETLQKLAQFAEKMGSELDRRNQGLQSELKVTSEGLDHVCQVVSRQQRHAQPTSANEPLELDQLVKDAITLSVTEPHIEVRTDMQPDAWVNLDKHLLLQVIGNLLRNAVHAMTDVSDEQAIIDIKVQHQDDHATIQVSDRGVGISQSAQERLFEYGFTTKSTGHGFGLHSCAIAVQKMGGELRFHSDGEGCGAEFTIVLPRVKREPGLVAAS